MIADFNEARWAQLKEKYQAWWDRTSAGPLMNVVITGVHSAVEKPEDFCGGPFSAYPVDYPIERVLAHIEYTLSARRYLGCAYPTYLPDFGAGVNAAFCGADFEARPETVWFHPRRPETVGTLHLEHEPENPLFKRISEFYEKADAYFAGDIVLGMTHLNNGIDTPARFVDSVEFCMALFDDPENITRLVWENYELCQFYFRHFSGLMKHNRGFTMWGDIFAPEPWLGAQSDFCAMIGPEHFRRFILPELTACMAASPRYNFYHLDGRGELPHLDMILDIPHLQTVQWVISAGDETPDAGWMWLYKKIHDAGKRIWYMGPEQNLDLLADTLGDMRGVYWQTYGGVRDEERLARALERFSAYTY